MTKEGLSEILAGIPLHLSEVPGIWAERSPDHPALVEADGTWTYEQLRSTTADTRAWLAAAGIRSGDRVMVVGENCRAFVAIFLALAGLDAWPVLISPKLATHEIDQIRDHCGARRIIYVTTTSPPAKRHAQRHSATISEALNLGQIGLGPLNERAEQEPVDANPSDRVAAVIYTSGTTGHPKGVMLTHRNLLFIAAVSSAIRSLTSEDRLYGILPLSHAVGLSVVLLGALLRGATVYLTSVFDPAATVATLEKERLTVVLGTPAFFSFLVEYAKLKGKKTLKLPALRIISSSGAPLHLALKSDAEKLLGLPLHNGYGVTESSPNIAQTRIESPRTDTSVGPAFPCVEIALVDSQGRQVPEGEIGELRARGPNIMKGYYRAPQETAAALDAEGWFKTRDLARMQDGNYFIVGRATEMIVRFGFNVYPAEVEAVLNAHPAVAQSAVIGRSVEEIQGGEEVVAFVSAAEGQTLSVSDLEDHARKYLASFKLPSRIHLVTSMPMTATGKIAKGDLAKVAMGDT